MREVFLQGFILYAIISLLVDSYTKGVVISIQGGFTSFWWFIFAFIIRMCSISLFSFILGLVVSTVANFIF